jgi:CRISPR-associated protein Cmr6
MPQISSTAKNVPMMFRAQIEGRCQLQRIDPTRKKSGQDQDVERWVDEWTDKAEEYPPQFNAEVQHRAYQISWRFVTNGGQDDGVIRPVIGARGTPYYPGSSMKGIFRRACRDLEAKGDIPAGTCDRYCGSKGDRDCGSKDTSPGILRFHGGYPTSDRWTEGLLDLIHPQQSWQLKTEDTFEKAGGAFAQVSLYKPELSFGISSAIPLEEDDWNTIWKIWEKGLSMGIGCRVSTGYGQIVDHQGDILFRCRLQGQGIASKRLDNSLEFRPNIFRAALRGHALRIFGGLTSQTNAETLVDTLFGGIQRGQDKWGLLAMTFRDHNLTLNQDKGTYNVMGDLTWFLTQSIPDEQQTALEDLVRRLMQFAIVFGGFGKSWRRADHRLFMEDYEKHLIGCHWQWAGARSPVRHNPVRTLDNISSFIENVQTSARTWMEIQGVPLSQPPASWREVWHPDNVQVWGRVAENRDDCTAIQWLHREYGYDYQRGREIPLSIKRTSVTGELNRIGRLWHRMYPIVGRKPDPDNEGKFIPQNTPKYLELLTLFPDDTSEFRQFLEFLQSQRSKFSLRWGKITPRN